MFSEANVTSGDPQPSKAGEPALPGQPLAGGVNKLANSPWFKFFAADFLLDPDVDDLPLEAQAILLRMWCVCWIEGFLPNDPEKISRKCRIMQTILQKYMQNLMQMFVQKDGKLISERMESERAKSKIISKVRKDAALKSHENRWDNGFADGFADANDNANVPAKTMHSDSDSQMSDLGSNSKSKTRSKPYARKTRGPVNNSKAAKASGETRHTRVKQIIQGWYLDWAGEQCPWDGSDAGNLDKLLVATPGWEDHAFVTCLDNLARSDCIPKGDRPREWLCKLMKFLKSPLDKYWKPIGAGNGSDSKAGEKLNRNREAIVLGLTGQSDSAHAGHSVSNVQRSGADAGTGVVLEGSPQGSKPPAGT